MRPRVVIALWVGAVSLTVVVVTLRLSGVVKSTYLDLYSLAPAAIAFSTLGAFLATKRPGNRVGLVFLFVGCAEPVVVTLGQAAYSNIDSPMFAGTLANFMTATIAGFLL